MVRWRPRKCEWPIERLREIVSTLEPGHKAIFAYFFRIMRVLGFDQQDSARWAWGCMNNWYSSIPARIAPEILGKIEGAGMGVGVDREGGIDPSAPAYVPGHSGIDKPLAWWIQRWLKGAK